jgi:hypothetical protein
VRRTLSLQRWHPAGSGSDAGCKKLRTGLQRLPGYRSGLQSEHSGKAQSRTGCRFQLALVSTSSVRLAHGGTEMQLVSLRDQKVCLDGLSICFREYEPFKRLVITCTSEMLPVLQQLQDFVSSASGWMSERLSAFNTLSRWFHPGRSVTRPVSSREPHPLANDPRDHSPPLFNNSAWELICLGALHRRAS